jgi:hypothetical protein
MARPTMHQESRINTAAHLADLGCWGGWERKIEQIETDKRVDWQLAPVHH